MRLVSLEHALCWLGSHKLRAQPALPVEDRRRGLTSTQIACCTRVDCCAVFRLWLMPTGVTVALDVEERPHA